MPPLIKNATYPFLLLGIAIASTAISTLAVRVAHISDNWILKAQEIVGFPVADAADSPIVEEEIQSRTLLLLGYRF